VTCPLVARRRKAAIRFVPHHVDQRRQIGWNHGGRPGSVVDERHGASTLARLTGFREAVGQ
jgi:hypothetical protein